MAELVYAYGLGPYPARVESSSLSSPTSETETALEAVFVSLFVKEEDSNAGVMQKKTNGVFCNEAGLRLNYRKIVQVVGESLLAHIRNRNSP